MRIRQVRPEFWTDEVLAHLSDPVRLFYIGLWNAADDAGYLRWQPAQLGALLYPYRQAHQRQRQITRWGQALVEAGRLEIMECGCALIATLARHQRVAGNQSFTVRDAHRSHGVAVRGYRVLTSSPVEERRVEEGNVEVDAREAQEKYDADMAAAWRRQHLPVDVVQ